MSDRGDRISPKHSEPLFLQTPVLGTIKPQRSHLHPTVRDGWHPFCEVSLVAILLQNFL